MSVTVIRPELTDEEREKRLQEIDRRVADVAKAKAYKLTIKKRCALCGEEYTAHSYHSKYCAKCREQGRKASDQRSYYRQEVKRRAGIRKKYEEGVIYVCCCCGKKIRVHERTCRKICDSCLASRGGDGRHRVSLRKVISEEVVDDV